ncbi:transglycosylase family protein [Streptomyces sp. BI20]|uniref:transglycosylase family protein n=1 Tax=Streptomyces sp. BI20 TaxID=3403460 RepID=UPI003C72DAE5
MLLTGKGKHRRASKATRVVTLAGVAGVAVAAPLMAAGTANAATGAEWDRVAQCESGGNWSINTGNGYYGGLQFSASTWKAYGGGAYASYAHKATKAQQITIAEKVLKGQGKGAWPHCGKGLSNTPYNGGSGGGTTTPSKPNPSKPTTPTTGKTYKVKSGDTLASIAKANKVAGGWQKLYQLNKNVLKNPNVIHVGQVLKLA